jgi:hypothetical protein
MRWRRSPRSSMGTAEAADFKPALMRKRVPPTAGDTTGLGSARHCSSRRMRPLRVKGVRPRTRAPDSAVPGVFVLCSSPGPNPPAAPPALPHSRPWASDGGPTASTGARGAHEPPTWLSTFRAVARAPPSAPQTPQVPLPAAQRVGFGVEEARKFLPPLETD